MTLVGAAAAAQTPLDAAELAYRFIDASYRSIDSREMDEHRGLPGVTGEYRQAVTVGKWGAVEYVNAGIEGYGWGAVSILLLMRYLLGFREEEAGIIKVAPILPQVMRRVGAAYRAGPVPWGKYLLYVECAVRDVHSYIMRVRCSLQAVPDSAQEMAEQQWEWEGACSLPDTFFYECVMKEKRSYLGQGGEEQNTRSSQQAEQQKLFGGRPQWIHLVYSGRTGMSN